MSEFLLNIGDQIQATPSLGKPWVSTIIRVTKTKAIGNIPGNTAGKMEFHRLYKNPDSIRRKIMDCWDTTDFKLLKK